MAKKRFYYSLSHQPYQHKCTDHIFLQEPNLGRRIFNHDIKCRAIPKMLNLPFLNDCEDLICPNSLSYEQIYFKLCLANFYTGLAHVKRSNIAPVKI